MLVDGGDTVDVGTTDSEDRVLVEDGGGPLTGRTRCWVMAVLALSITSSGERGRLHDLSLLDFLTFLASKVSVNLRIPSRFRKRGSI